MQMTEHLSYFTARCGSCGQTVLISRTEMKDAFRDLLKGSVYVEFSLGCACSTPAKAATGKSLMELDAD